MSVFENRAGERSDPASTVIALIGSLAAGLTIAAFGAGFLAEDWKDAGVTQPSSRTAPPIVAQAAQFATMADASFASLSMTQTGAGLDEPEFPTMADAAFALR